MSCQSPVSSNQTNHLSVVTLPVIMSFQSLAKFQLACIFFLFSACLIALKIYTSYLLNKGELMYWPTICAPDIRKSDRVMKTLVAVDNPIFSFIVFRDKLNISK